MASVSSLYVSHLTTRMHPGKTIPQSMLTSAAKVVAIKTYVGNENELPLNEV